MEPHPAGDPPEPLGTTATTTGIVKWYKTEKGYGCIESTQTSPWDIWCHFSAIEGEGSGTSSLVSEWLSIMNGQTRIASAIALPVS